MDSAEVWEINQRTMAELRRAAERRRLFDLYRDAVSARTKAMTMDSMIRHRRFKLKEISEDATNQSVFTVAGPAPGAPGRHDHHSAVAIVFK